MSSRARPLGPFSAALLVLAALASCARAPLEVPVPAARPDLAALRPAAPARARAEPPPAPSAESEALALYYRRLQANLLSQGLLRGDDGAADAPFTDTMLARDFAAIALFDEFAPDSATVAAGEDAGRLRRWEQPIRLDAEFSATMGSADVARDRASLDAYASRLSRLTGLPIAQAAADPNFHVLVLDEDDREKSEERLRTIYPSITDALVRDIVNLPRSTLCLVFAPQGEASYSRAVVLIRAELPDLLRTACIHEELAQGLGLVNDSPQARPSIFNDNDEFGRLTGHDELLLRMLYDPRLRPGMTAEEAEPVAREVAAELVGGPA